MSNFAPFGKAVNEQFNMMSRDQLYIVDLVDIWESYLNAFPAGTNELFRTNNENDCNCCRHFIQRLGNVVSISDNKIVSIWDNFENLPEPYYTVSACMSQLVQQAEISSVFYTLLPKIGLEKNLDSHENITWNHFWADLPRSCYSDDADKERGIKNTTFQVFKRGLDELKLSAFDIVIDLIEDKLLYRGDEFLESVKAYRAILLGYQESNQNPTFVWGNLNNPVARIRNQAIGTLLINLSKGETFEVAVGKFEAVVAPQNYKRSSALVTPAMIETGLKKIRELDLEPALDRRFARISDVSVNDVLFVDNSVRADMKDSLKDSLMASVAVKEVKLTNVTNISVEDFFKDVVPTATSIGLNLKNSHLSNLVTLTAPVAEDIKPIFQWDNNFSWSYDGEVADSVEQRVKNAGGKINVPLRVSLAWYNTDDLDIHASCPDGKIYYRNKKGILDVDMNVSKLVTDPVENLSWVNPKIGDYSIQVNNFTKRNNTDMGFVIETAVNGEISQYKSSISPKDGHTTPVMSFKWDGNKITNLRITNMTGGEISTDKWNIKTETLVPVDTIMLSPNFWNQQTKGNKHYFFILKDCKNPDPVRGIYNEFLRTDLNEHRKLFELLGSKTKCQPTDDQLSGLGFSSTKRASIGAVVTTESSKRAYNIQF